MFSCRIQQKNMITNWIMDAHQDLGDALRTGTGWIGLLQARPGKRGHVRTSRRGPQVGSRRKPPKPWIILKRWCELRKKPPTFTFRWRLIWGACAKGKCWFAKARESNSDRESRESWHVNMYINIGDLVQQICERFAKDVRKVRESWGVQSPGVPFSWSALNGKCKTFLWKYYTNHFHANMCWEQVSKRKQKWSDPAACTSSSLPHIKSIDKPTLVLDILHPFLRERVAKGFVQPCVPRELKLWSRKWCESSREGMLPV